MDLHRYLLQVAQGVEQLTDEDDGLHADISQEGNGSQRQESYQAGNTHQSFDMLRHR